MPALTRALLLPLLFVASLAVAQTASSEGILTQGSWCLDVQGNHTRASPPPVGTRVVAAPCAGRITQRWTMLRGDYSRIDGIGGRRLGMGVEANGRAPVVLADRHPEIDLRDGALRSDDGRCVTRHGAEVWLEACRPGDPAQRWEMR